MLKKYKETLYVAIMKSISQSTKSKKYNCYSFEYKLSDLHNAKDTSEVKNAVFSQRNKRSNDNHLVELVAKDREACWPTMADWLPYPQKPNTPNDIM